MIILQTTRGGTELIFLDNALTLFVKSFFSGSCLLKLFWIIRLSPSGWQVSHRILKKNYEMVERSSPCILKYEYQCAQCSGIPALKYITKVLQQIGYPSWERLHFEISYVTQKF